MFRRKPVLDFGGYSVAHCYVRDDELWLWSADIGDIVVLPQVLLRSCGHDESISAKSMTEQESCSLAGTKHRIARMIAKELNLQQLRELREF
jgi:hypothetical protein